MPDSDHTNAEDIPFAGQLTEKEYRAVLRAARPAFLKLLPWLVLAASVVVPLMGGVRQLLAHPAEQLPPFGTGLFLVAVLLVAPEMAMRSSWHRNRQAHEPVSGAVTKEAIHWEGSSAQASLPWPVLRGYRERKGVLLIYTASKQAFWLLPRFFSTAHDWDRARALISGNLRRR